MSRWRKRLLVVAGAFALWMGYVAIFNGGFDDRFAVTREVVLEPGLGWFTKAVVATSDGGQVVAGSFRERYRWATRLDANGRVRWAYRTTPADAPLIEEHKSDFFGVAQLSNDSTALCGTDYVGAGDGNGYIERGLLTRIDSTGKVVDERVLSPRNDDSYSGSGFYQCLPVHDGFLAIGKTLLCRGPVPPPPARRCTDHHWLVAFDSDGRILWERLEASSTRISTIGARAAVLPSGEIVVLIDGNGSRFLPSQVLRFNSEGKFVDVVGKIPTHAVLVEPPETSKIEVISLERAQSVLLTFSDTSREPEELPLPIGRFNPNRAYRATDSSLILTGTSRELGSAAGIERITRSGPSALRLEPVHASSRIDDAIPTAVAGEFATVRRVDRTGMAENDPRIGATLTVVRLRWANPLDVIATQVRAIVEPVVAVATHPLDAIVALGIAWVDSRSNRPAESAIRPAPTVPQPPLNE